MCTYVHSSQNTAPEQVSGYSRQGLWMCDSDNLVLLLRAANNSVHTAKTTHVRYVGI